MTVEETLSFFENIPIYKTNLGLGYNEYAYLVQVRDLDFLCVFLEVYRDTNSFALGCPAKFTKYEITTFENTDYKITDSPLWNGFSGWIINILHQHSNLLPTP